MERRRLVRMAGGGPAGASAALAALAAGAAVEVFEKSPTPRHKVCGEFLSPGILPCLERLGVAGAFAECRPAQIRRMRLHIGRAEKQSALPEPGWGLSRFAFDHMLLTEAAAAGAALRREPAGSPEPGMVWAVGRERRAARGGRLFGFKAHFKGEPDDAVELFFFNHCYVGINAVENGRTNVCGLAPEETLSAYGFVPDAVVEGYAPLRERLSGLRRTMPWLITGPLVFANRLHAAGEVYAAGDALSFIDPFTGSGLLTAVLTGSAAGAFASRGLPVSDYVEFCRGHIARPFRCASWLRERAAERWAEAVLPAIPGRWLFSMTRPRDVA